MQNNNEKEKKGLFARLTGKEKPKKNSCCCCNIELEEIPEDSEQNETPKDGGSSCCK